MNGDLSIRPAETGDLPAMQRICAAAFAPIFRGFREAVGAGIAALAFADAEADQARHLDQICADDAQHLLVVHRGDELIGFVAFSVDAARRTGLLGLNAVHPDHAGRGIGAWMYREALARMKALGAAAVEVGTGADAAHAPARRAYEKAGFGPAIGSVSLYRLL